MCFSEKNLCFFFKILSSCKLIFILHSLCYTSWNPRPPAGISRTFKNYLETPPLLSISPLLPLSYSSPPLLSPSSQFLSLILFAYTGISKTTVAKNRLSSSPLILYFSSPPFLYFSSPPLFVPSSSTPAPLVLFYSPPLLLGLSSTSFPLPLLSSSALLLLSSSPPLLLSSSSPLLLSSSPPLLLSSSPPLLLSYFPPLLNPPLLNPLLVYPPHRKFIVNSFLFSSSHPFLPSTSPNLSIYLLQLPTLFISFHPFSFLLLRKLSNKVENLSWKII